MNLTPLQKKLIQQVINVFETGTANGNYGAISIYNDGPHNIRQITYGRSQTTEYGNLAELISDYVKANGLFSLKLKPYADRIGHEPLTEDAVFKQLLKDAGRKDPIMAATQDAFFEKRYFAPAMAWADANGFKLPLSMLVIYDSYIHSGSILKLIRAKFPEVPPAKGGDEKAWIKAYTTARDSFLANHSTKIVQKTVYRTRYFLLEIGRNNWNLDILPLKPQGVVLNG